VQPRSLAVQKLYPGCGLVPFIYLPQWELVVVASLLVLDGKCRLRAGCQLDYNIVRGSSAANLTETCRIGDAAV